jgi:hypothetical protein
LRGFEREVSAEVIVAAVKVAIVKAVKSLSLRQ